MTTVSIELEHETCWCGMPFMLPRDLRYQARNRNHTIYCPLGHTITWEETEETRLRRERDRLKQQTAQLEDDLRAAHQRADNAAKETRRLKKRAAAGACPCCQRNFINMARHMKTKHPQFIAENVVPIKAKA